ncbi:MAG: hypothetical protein Alis3KO_25620 [Aliiglaciecola sp.]
MSKKIYFHVGPPKTGTSAIQKWLLENSNFLRKNLIYYPDHGIDDNGVSSGNVLSIYDIDESKQLTLSKPKLNSVIEEFEKSECNTLLLSSEFFFRKMSELKSHVPQACFIAYVRNPLEIKESSYNQSVKRHFQTEVINPKLAKKLPYMSCLTEFAKNFGTDSLNIRLYGNKYFIKRNIVSDLLSVLGIDVEAKLPIVNSSYQFEALEFKRWINQFELREFQVVIDRSLQAFSSGRKDYSLIPTDIHAKSSKQFAELLEEHAKQLESPQLVTLANDIKKTKPKHHIDQKLNGQQFLKVSNFLQERLGYEYYCLVQRISEIKVDQKDEFYEMFVNSLKARFRYFSLYYMFKQKLKKFSLRLK